ncbi:hypothetical protein Ahy_B01g055267 [Arachis hypogaea]|uniref:Protein FAR1-RELATED SEQUENCE n=1 Tax=Arachis hypogaea TaxID=3818 RepID=A0A445AVP3_ARAHY|nr:hypothetical protein Ahy_B01g055267 [Arachis hypogaea]
MGLRESTSSSASWCSVSLHRSTFNVPMEPQPQLMLGDYEVGVFEEKWEEIVGCFGVEDCKWIIDMYGKRNMWATTHIQEIFLLGLEQLQDIAELPKSLVLRRWTGKAKEGISRYDDIGSLMEDSLAISRHACFEKNGSIETETTRKPKRCSYCRKGGHNIATCSMRKMDERTPQFDGDAEENVEGEDYSFVDTESDEYVHTEWFDNEDKYLDSSRYYKQSGSETESSMDFNSSGIKSTNDDDEAEL